LNEKNLRNIIEALIFASEEELSSEQIKNLLYNCNISVSIKEIEDCINNINEEYKNKSNAFEIIKIAGGYQFATRKEYSDFISKMRIESQRKKLSQSALETLAIIAYKQPITRSEIEFIRGVNVDYIVNSLLEKDLIMIKGRANSPGRPIIYGTTDNFLKILGLNSLEDLPKLKEINEILKNEKIEGIKEEDIELFNSLNNIHNKEEKPNQLFNNTEVNNTEKSNTTSNIPTKDDSNEEL